MIVGINWLDIDVFSDSGINWVDIDVLSDSGINWNDFDGLMSAGNVNWVDLGCVKQMRGSTG